MCHTLSEETRYVGRDRFITGASSGLGYELAKLFAADKSNLVLVARSRKSWSNWQRTCAASMA